MSPWNYICILPDIKDRFMRNVCYVFFRHCDPSNNYLMNLHEWMYSTKTHGLQRMNPADSWHHHQSFHLHLNIHCRRKIFYGHSRSPHNEFYWLLRHHWFCVTHLHNYSKDCHEICWNIHFLLRMNCTTLWRSLYISSDTQFSIILCLCPTACKNQ